MSTVNAALRAAVEAGAERWDAQQLMAHLLGCDRAGLVLRGNEVLAPATLQRWQADVARLMAGEPLAYLTGVQGFHGLLLQVSPDTLIPRPDTEVLVDWAIELVRARRAGDTTHAVDLGTGSGAIALAVRQACPQVDMTAVDISPGALRVAQCNAQQLGLPIRFVQGSWWQPLVGQTYDLVLSNPPYIHGQDPHLAALGHEPLGALTPGGDGLDDLRRLAEGAPAHLRPGGWILMEHGHDQAAAVAELLRAQGLQSIQTRVDLAARPRVTGAQQPD